VTFQTEFLSRQELVRTVQLTEHMEYSPTPEANRYSSSQGISSIL
jgi:hypothetical protein